MTKEYFGKNSIIKLKDIIDRNNPSSIFLVTGKKSYDISGAREKIEPILKEKNITHFNSFSVNPTVGDVKKGISDYKKTKPDMVIAVGGGSVLDIAKAINALSYQSDKPEEYITGKKNMQNNIKPLISIPLTAGTGSEVTRFATIYYKNKKYSLSKEKYTLPEFAIIDPKLTDSMPKKLTAITGLDAICQSIESIWAVGSLDTSRKYAFDSLKIGIKSIEKSVKNPDEKTREHMAKTAYLSGKAINISRTTACHSISYPMTSYFGISHGHAVALTMPVLIEYNSNVKDDDCNDPRGPVFVKKQIDKIIKIIGYKNPIDAKNGFSDLIKKLGLENRLRDLKIDKDGIDLIIREGFTPRRMNNNPRIIKEKDLKKILEEIW